MPPDFRNKPGYNLYFSSYSSNDFKCFVILGESTIKFFLEKKKKKIHLQMQSDPHISELFHWEQRWDYILAKSVINENLK